MPNNVTSPTFGASAAMSGQVTVTTAGTEVQGTDVSFSNGVFVKALAGNTGVVYVGNAGDGTVSATTGFQLAAGDVILVQVSNLRDLWFDSASNGDKLCWLRA
jgi:hypothetical protein